MDFFALLLYDIAVELQKIDSTHSRNPVKQGLCSF